MDDDRQRQRRIELGSFLRSKRDAMPPGEAGFAPTGRRHVTGLRREEVAQRAGIGASWYTLLEQGRAESVSAKTLERIADALNLSRLERVHLLALGRADGIHTTGELPETVKHFVRHGTAGPAFVMTAMFDIVTANDRARDLFALSPDAGARQNLLELMLFDASMQRIFPTWHETVANMIGVLRVNYARAGNDAFDAFIAQLRARSPIFTAAWETRTAHVVPESICIVDHPLLGRTTMHIDAFFPVAAPGHLMMCFTPAAPGSTDGDVGR